MKIKINGVEVEVDESVANYVTSLVSENDKLKAEVDVLKSQEPTKPVVSTETVELMDGKIDALVGAKVELITLAKDSGIVLDAKTSVIDMKKAIIGVIAKDIVLDGKSDDYIGAVLDMCKGKLSADVEKQKKIEDSQRRASGGFETAKTVDTSFTSLTGKEI